MQCINRPLVTVICTCYNHAAFVGEAIRSVLQQSYSPIQLIVIDNKSTDGSVSKIQQIVEEFPSILFIANEENIGLCKAFNKAAIHAQGAYLIDLSADDVLTLDRIHAQVTCFEQLGNAYGMLYSNAEEISSDGSHLRFSLNREREYPSGWIFSELLDRHFIPSPSTMFRMSTFRHLNGYNEALAFEDFDFWVRCGRQFKIHYLPIISVKKRKLSGSLSSHFYSTTKDDMLRSTWQTFRWAQYELHDQNDIKGFRNGASYYYRQSVWLGHFSAADLFYSLLVDHTQHLSLLTKIARIVHRMKLPLKRCYRLWQKIAGV